MVILEVDDITSTVKPEEYAGMVAFKRTLVLKLVKAIHDPANDTMISEEKSIELLTRALALEHNPRILLADILDLCDELQVTLEYSFKPIRLTPTFATSL